MELIRRNISTIIRSYDGNKGNYSAQISVDYADYVLNLMYNNKLYLLSPCTTSACGVYIASN